MEPLSWQLTIDARDPHAQAQFWADVLHAGLEDNEALIERVLGAGMAEESQTLTFRGKRYWAELVAVRAEGRPRILFQRVPEAKTVKNRLHLDLNVGGGRRQAEVERVVGLGASVVREVDEPSGHWVLCTDPEGNEFCVQ